MLVSIITATYNNENLISNALNSISRQSYKKIQHIIVDGGSSDKTLEIVKKYPHISKIISEKDNGIYDALNKGIKIADGEIIGILHSDDEFYSSDIIEKIVFVFENKDIDVLYGDLVYIDFEGKKIIRYWKSEKFYPKLLKRGWMPPHPTLFVKRKIYETYGLFNTNFEIAADYEFILRIFSQPITPYYLNNIITKMRWGGKSNRLSNILKKMYEDYKAIKMHRIGGFDVLMKKNFSKISQFFVKN